ncbi:hypothetical protein [Streptomyces lunalinharesii]|uniref:Uncharacterized protein n=1 Tax=Streptomyces lunalinharesii TaxID=333384 RepID=A0ABP6F7F3_9ACTN
MGAPPSRDAPGPLLAREVLDLAAADAEAGLPLAERVRTWPRIVKAEPQLHVRLLASRLVAYSLAAGTVGTDAATADAAGAVGQCGTRRSKLRYGCWPASQPASQPANQPADRTPAEVARLVARALRLRAGDARPRAEIGQVLPAGAEAGRLDGTVEPLAS